MYICAMDVPAVWTTDEQTGDIFTGRLGNRLTGNRHTVKTDDKKKGNGWTIKTDDRPTCVRHIIEREN